MLLKDVNGTHMSLWVCEVTNWRDLGQVTDLIWYLLIWGYKHFLCGFVSCILGVAYSFAQLSFLRYVYTCMYIFDWKGELLIASETSGCLLEPT